MSRDPRELTPHIVGVISDTHGLLRPEAVKYLDGFELIIHAGDIGRPDILENLRAVGPVVAIRGNRDRHDWARKLPETETVQIGAASIYVLHDLNHLDLDPAASGFDAVISGHSHRPSILHRGTVLFLNPGSAGPRRLKLPISLAILRIEDGSVEGELMTFPIPRNPRGRGSGEIEDQSKTPLSISSGIQNTEARRRPKFNSVVKRETAKSSGRRQEQTNAVFQIFNITEGL